MKFSKALLLFSFSIALVALLEPIAASAQSPTILRVFPNALVKTGTTIEVPLRISGFDFPTTPVPSPFPEVSIGGGMAVDAVRVVDDQAVEGTLVIDESARPGRFDVKVLFSNSISATLPGGFVLCSSEPCPLPSPAGLRLESAAQTGLILTWNEVSPADQYKVYRLLRNSFEEVGRTETAVFVDSRLEPGQTYEYKISALRDGEESVLSSSLSITTRGINGDACDPASQTNQCGQGLVCRTDPGGGSATPTCKTAATASSQPTDPGATDPPRTGILGFGDRLANIAFTALIITSVVMVLLSAFQFVSGEGNPEAISGARDKLIWAAVGFGIALVAKGIPAILQKILLPSEGGGTPKSLCPSQSITGTGIQNPLCTTDFSGILDSILNVIFTISVIVVPLVVIYAGFLFVTGGGNPQQLTKARDTLIWTAIGFGIILISKGLPFILKDILGFSA